MCIALPAGLDRLTRKGGGGPLPGSSRKKETKPCKRGHSEFKICLADPDPMQKKKLLPDSNKNTKCRQPVWIYVVDFAPKQTSEEITEDFRVSGL